MNFKIFKKIMKENIFPDNGILEDLWTLENLLLEHSEWLNEFLARISNKIWEEINIRTYSN